MDGKSMAFLQKEAGKALADCFASGLSLDNLLNCAVIQIQFYEAMQKGLVETLPPAKARFNAAPAAPPAAGRRSPAPSRKRSASPPG